MTALSYSPMLYIPLMSLFVQTNLWLCLNNEPHSQLAPEATLHQSVCSHDMGKSFVSMLVSMPCQVCTPHALVLPSNQLSFQLSPFFQDHHEVCSCLILEHSVIEFAEGKATNDLNFKLIFFIIIIIEKLANYSMVSAYYSAYYASAKFQIKAIDNLEEGSF